MDTKANPLNRTDSYSKLINLVHIAVIAPGLWALSTRPQWLRYTPYVAGTVVAVHGYEYWRRMTANTPSHQRIGSY